jgi:uncharacterized phiE125 gp8 family phage protein
MNFTGPYSDILPEGWAGYCRAGGRNLAMRKIFTTRGLPLPIDEVMLDLRVDSNDELETVKRMVRGACAMIEKRSGFAVLQGTYEVLLDSWVMPWPLEFLRAPVREITEIAILDEDASPSETWDPVELAGFRIVEQPKSFELYPRRNTTLPAITSSPGGLRIRFNAGYDVELVSGESESGEISDDKTLPLDDQVRTAIMMLTAHLYQNRELFAADSLDKVEARSASVLSSIRQWW